MREDALGAPRSRFAPALLAAALAALAAGPAAAHTDVTAATARAMILAGGVIVVDVREYSEFCSTVQHIPDALCLPVQLVRPAVADRRASQERDDPRGLRLGLAQQRRGDLARRTGVHAHLRHAQRDVRLELREGGVRRPARPAAAQEIRRGGSELDAGLQRVESDPGLRSAEGIPGEHPELRELHQPRAHSRVSRTTPRTPIGRSPKLRRSRAAPISILRSRRTPPRGVSPRPASRRPPARRPVSSAAPAGIAPDGRRRTAHDQPRTRSVRRPSRSAWNCPRRTPPDCPRSAADAQRPAAASGPGHVPLVPFFTSGARPSGPPPLTTPGIPRILSASSLPV